MTSSDISPTRVHDEVKPSPEPSADADEDAPSCNNLDQWLQSTSQKFDVTNTDGLSMFEEELKNVSAASLEELSKYEAQTQHTTPVDPIFLRAAETGDFDTRDKVGQKWSRAKKTPSIKTEYDKLTNTADKKAFMRSWAQEHFKHITANKSFAESYSETAETLGEMHTFGSLVVSYGGWEWPLAIEGAKKHALQCCSLGGSWATTDEMSGLAHFLKLKAQHKGIMAKKWQQLTTYVNGSGEDLTGNIVGTSEVGKGNGVKRAATTSASSHDQAKTPKTNPKTPTKIVNKAVADLTAKAMLVKREHNKAMQRADQLCKHIEENAEYSWAHNDQNLGHINRLMHEFRSQLSSFDKEILLVDWARIKGKYTDSNLEELLNSFINKLGYKGIDKFVDLILRRHKA
jgi:hypothetical protein